MNKLVVEEVSGAEALSSLAPEWRRLFELSGASPFLSWEWISAWHKWLGSGKHPRLFCAREGGLLVGLLALGEEDRRLKGTTARVRRISFLGDGLGGSDYLDVLSLPGYEQKCANVLFGYIAERVEFDILELDGLPCDSPSAPWLAWRFGSDTSFSYRLEPRYVCPQVRLDKPWEELLRSFSRATYLSRSLRRLRKLQGFEHRVVTDPDQAAPAFERFLALHESSWANRGGSSATGSRSLKDFHRDVVVRLALAGRLRFEEIWIDGACRASLYGISGGDRRYYYYLAGYDPAWARYSLGGAVIALSIAGAVERGVKFYDLLRGAEAYKFDWANETRATFAAHVASDSLPARLAVLQDRAKEAARAAAYAVLPARMLAFWRRRRQAQMRRSTERPSVNEENDRDKTGDNENTSNDITVVEEECLESGFSHL
ncbi:MAG: GNAT family N-acetyltransferase [Chloracidobacterium sp.]|nr:GNAT family N-acetyltransferase [Chloracidobacterium sp.]